MPLFGKSHKSPQELTRILDENLKYLINTEKKDAKKMAKVQEDISKTLLHMKTILYGTADTDPSPEAAAQLSGEMCNGTGLQHLVKALRYIDFEGRKDAAQIFSNVLRRKIGSRTPTVDYICSRKEILTCLMKGYEDQEIALNCGMMLRECCRAQSLAAIVINSPEFYDFFNYVEVSTFDIASDAFSTFKIKKGQIQNFVKSFLQVKQLQGNRQELSLLELLTRHKLLCAEFLEENYDKVFLHYQRLLNSENYVTRRQALKLLGELLLDRHNFTTMTRYISNPDNLKLMMNMLREKSRNIQFEAFHVFKVFVANPNKPRPILDILMRNKDKLVDFLEKFHTDRSEDEQFNDEKAYLIKQIKELKPYDEQH